MQVKGLRILLKRQIKAERIVSYISQIADKLNIIIVKNVFYIQVEVNRQAH